MTHTLRKTAPRGKAVGGPALKSPSETEISRQIQSALRSLRHIVIRVHSGSLRAGSHWAKMAEKGTPDLLVLTTTGYAVMLEVKTPDGKLSPEQEHWHAEATAMGHRVAVVRSVRDALEAVR